MQQIDLIRDCCNKHPTSDIMNHRVDVKTLTWLAGQTHNMLELIDYQAARISKLEADQGLSWTIYVPGIETSSSSLIDW